MLAAGQEQQYEQCSPLCLPYKQYYTQHPRCQFSCIMPEKRQSWYFRKQMIVTEVICQAQIQRPAVLRGPQWFSSATHVGTPLRKVTNVRWNWDVKNGEFPKDYYSFSSLIPPFPLLKWNAQFPHQKQSDWAAQHRPEWRSQPPYAEAPTGCAWGTFHFTHTWAWIGQAAAGPQALYAMQGMQQQAVTPCWVPGWCDLSVWCSQQQSTNQRLWSYSGAREPPLQLHVTHSPFWQTTKPLILPFFPPPSETREIPHRDLIYDKSGRKLRPLFQKTNCTSVLKAACKTRIIFFSDYVTNFPQWLLPCHGVLYADC